MRGDEFFQAVAVKPPFNKLHPRVASFFKDYLAREKVVRFGDRFVVNTNFPPFPSPAFDRFAEGFSRVAEGPQKRLHSVTLAVTNRCPYRCWHCYNSGRSQKDIPLPRLRRLAAELGELGAVCVTLTGGEPLLRGDLEDIVSAFDERFYLSLGTTGCGLTPERARSLKGRGLFAVGISLDSEAEAEHDRLRGKAGAFRTALAALRMCRDAGLYSYAVAVASRGLLERERFLSFLRFAKSAGAYEVHLLEPCPIGSLKGRQDAVLSPADSRLILDYQAEVARDEGLPILSCFAYVEAPEAFGCGAGLTHLYIDGSGEVSPCNFVPLSFGSILDQPLAAVLERMGRRFRRPRPSCVGKVLSARIPDGPVPLPPEASEELCERWLPKEHDIPRFFRVRSEATSEAGSGELRAAYDSIHADYDEFWVCEAGKPVEALVAKLPWKGTESVFEAGCGTGYGTALIARRLTAGGSLLAADLSAEMLSLARRRLAASPESPVRFAEGDALELLRRNGEFDLVFTSWVLGYIPLAPFFQAAAGALAPGGRLAFIVHRENSPRRELELFYALGAQDPEILAMRVAFDFPTRSRVEAELQAAGLRPAELWEGAVTFRYPTPQAVLEHLLKSGAGTAYYNAVKPSRRAETEKKFLDLLRESNAGKPDYEVVHDFVACVATR
ncbi:MAG: radical SAM protein [Elusimicrobia bacterium]|nr:radical SAM protein [Elusimicrobiota bacterium]